MTALSNLLNDLNVNGLSSRQIEAAAEKRGHKLSYATASRYLKGTHPDSPSADVLEALAAVFSTDVNKLRAAIGQPYVSDRFELPPEADQLDPDERTAVVNLVRVMAGKKKAGEDNASTPHTQAGVSPADDIRQLKETQLFTDPPPADMAAYETRNRDKEEQERSNQRGEERQ